MKKIRLSTIVGVVFLTLLFFLAFSVKNSQSKEEKNYDRFRTEVSTVLYCLSPSDESFKTISESVYFVLSEQNQEMMISIFIGEPEWQKSKPIWAIEEQRLNDKNVEDLAERAAYIILYYFSKSALPEIIIPSPREPLAI